MCSYTLDTRKRQTGLLLYTSPRKNYGHPECKSGRCLPLSEGEEKNLLPNIVRLEISGGGQLCTSNMLYRIPSPLGLCRTKTFRWIVFVRGKVARGRMRGHKGTCSIPPTPLQSPLRGGGKKFVAEHSEARNFRWGSIVWIQRTNPHPKH